MKGTIKDVEGSEPRDDAAADPPGRGRQQLAPLMGIMGIPWPEGERNDREHASGSRMNLGSHAPRNVPMDVGPTS